MNIPRRGHACGKFDKEGKIVIIVAGGYDQSLQDLDSIEYLIPSTGQGWKFGKYNLLNTITRGLYFLNQNKGLFYVIMSSKIEY